ncbi:hypothetical protein Q7P35_006143 [Cladosporium inversicolor]
MPNRNTSASASSLKNDALRKQRREHDCVALALIVQHFVLPAKLIPFDLSVTHITRRSLFLEGSTHIEEVNSSPQANMTRTPVYFLSHGGPNLFEDYSHPAYAKLQAIGHEITHKVKPKAVVVFSAHWQGDRNAIEVNTATTQGLIYDYYGFPPHYYKVQYPNTGSPELADKILNTLQGAGIKAEGVRRGLDHGVFAPFIVAFNPEKNPLNVPVVQVSLFGSEDPAQHHALGKALAPLREEGVVVICSGMAVHNLRDFQRSYGRPGNQPYAVSFDDALKEAAEQNDAEAREKAMVALLQRSDARKAHPTFEHLLPVHVAAGAAGSDKGKQLWTLPEGSMSWAQFRFGEVEAASQLA